ncbi:serine hydrolase [Candidatus Bipolaricaulota bacterium]
MKSWIALVLVIAVGILALGSPSGFSSREIESGEVLLSDTVTTNPNAPVYPGREWTWAETPEALGWSSEKLEKARALSERIGSAAVMIVDDGVVVDAWGDITLNYYCHSMRKSLMSALYGIYVNDGAIDLSKTLQELGIDDTFPLTGMEKAATVSDLLKARSGVYIAAAGESQGMVATRPARFSHRPGTFWYYNNWDFNTLGTIFDQETGEESIYAAFQARIATRVGMQDFRPDDLSYSYVPYSMHPYYGFEMSTRDLARFGLLFLREGRWEDQRLIPVGWIHESTASHSETGPESGYGYMWWTGSGNGLFPNVTVESYSYYASGYGGHKVVVLPYRNLVIVHRVDTFAGEEEEVSEEEFGILLWRILDAAGETDIGEPPFIEAAPGIRLDTEGLISAVSGNVLQMIGGAVDLAVAFDPDRTLSILYEGNVLYTGTWYVVIDTLFVDVPGTDIGGRFQAVLDDTTIRLYTPEGMLSARFKIMEE